MTAKTARRPTKGYQKKKAGGKGGNGSSYGNSPCKICQQMNHDTKPRHKEMEDAMYVTHDNDLLHTSKITIDSWLANSATSSHICNNKNAFVQFTLVHTHVKGVRGVFVSAEGQGTMHLISHINNNKIQIVLSNVLYVPSAPNNLFSMTRLDELEGRAVMGNGIVRLYDKNKLLIAISKKKD